MKSIIASILTSIIVSLFTFVLGLKSGKNQADRAFLQSQYKQLYAHFCELENRLREKNPKHWDEYKSISDRNSIRYYPLVRDMERSGDILYIKKRLAQQALKLELDCLVYPDDIEKLCVVVHEKLIKSPELFNGKLVDTSYDKKNNPFAKIETSNPTNCSTFRPVSYEYLLDKERLTELLKNDGSKYALAFRMRGNPPKREFIIYPDSLAKENSVFAEVITNFAKENSNCIDVEKELLKRLEKLKKQLAKRAKNPTSFWETFAGAFWDIFQ